MEGPRSSNSSPSRSRLRPAVVDPLEQAGFVSKGDTVLLNVKAQFAYYERIMERYLKFCNDYSSDIDAAFASLPKYSTEDATKNPPVADTSTANKESQPNQAPQNKSSRPETLSDSASKDLSVLLLSLRKLREGVVATASETPLEFAQHVHVFCIRMGILAAHPPSYYVPLRRLLHELNEPSSALSESDLHEFTSYLILDYVCRRSDLNLAFELRAKSKAAFGYYNITVDNIVSALLHDNWVLYWKSGRHVDGYTRSLMSWSDSYMRRRALKAIAKTYLTADIRFIIECCTGSPDGCTWEELVKLEGIGWRREGDKAVIRIRKPKAA
ncbi:hypothetical protein H112_07711 [Trichophyton rubrum D6]|uniref:CSN8/PSMD8/EIF3K domain-containing protein n=4 Tax=Trichophyton TaxID=5550 RepID=F2SF45_TRIRC|nr:uncharacterized protein TERG_00312 [Trichophyton rubrum CBS 118892]EZF11123.1 hypothetical protein H100_07735 [Trichophyton rubrum MR850]EZF37987.1 hypothetical protein H102_07700 [Trichophyton rubrum CBS 100081]EZF48622.1 hypothetical protein H103_07723 [Trichophyton rubrum CBS 288.86]EZF59308.1 hypothetical protein H104_07672 [Trichophyton rubrum CBS 289.86]EZF69876.1 hypothetical protein H105_07727 [Trichophyton soudanense CBS 452.61]EZF80499.1 hypothetical protein H110_07721 [Trichophy